MLKVDKGDGTKRQKAGNKEGIRNKIVGIKVGPNSYLGFLSLFPCCLLSLGLGDVTLGTTKDVNLSRVEMTRVRQRHANRREKEKDPDADGERKREERQKGEMGEREKDKKGGLIRKRNRQL